MSSVDVGALLQKYVGRNYTHALFHAMVMDVKDAYEQLLANHECVVVPSINAIVGLVRAHLPAGLPFYNYDTSSIRESPRGGESLGDSESHLCGSAEDSVGSPCAQRRESDAGKIRQPGAVVDKTEEMSAQFREIMAAGPQPGSRWRHYKGGIYTVLYTAIDEETLRPRVIYQAADGTVWDRRQDVFLGTVVNESGPVLRFTPLG